MSPDMEHIRRVESDDFVQLLEEELASCYHPQVTEPSEAPIDDIIRDMHKILTGNGGPTKGLIFKVAAANVHIRTLRNTAGVSRELIDNQIRRCDDIHRTLNNAAAVADAERTTVGKIWEAIWENRASILVLLLAVLVYFTNLYAQKGIQAGVPPLSEGQIKQIEKVFEKAIDLKFQDLGCDMPATAKAE